MSSQEYFFLFAKDQKCALDILVMAIKKDDLQLFNYALEQSVPTGTPVTVETSLIVHYQMNETSK